MAYLAKTATIEVVTGTEVSVEGGISVDAGIGDSMTVGMSGSAVCWFSGNRKSTDGLKHNLAKSVAL